MSYTNEDPDLAAEALNRLVAAFQAKHVSLYSETQFDFLEDQLGRHGEDLTNAEKKLEEYQQSNRVYALEDQRTQLLRQQNEIDAALKAADNDYNALSAKAAILDNQIKQVPATVPLTSVTERSKVISQAEADLLSLRMKEQQLATRFGDRHPQIVSVREEIVRVETYLKSLNSSMTASETKGTNTVYQNLQGAILATQAESTRSPPLITLQAGWRGAADLCGSGSAGR